MESIMPNTSSRIRSLVLMVFAILAISLIIWSNLSDTAASLGGNLHAYITLIVMAAASILFITELLPVAVTSMFVPIVLTLTGVIPAKEAFNGLANDNVVLFGGIFVVGGALFQTQVARKIGDSVIRMAKGSQVKVVLGVIIVTGSLSSVLSNTGTVAVLMPVCIAVADAAGWNRGRILMPLAMMASLGGMITLVGTPPNMTANAILLEFGYREFGFLEFAWIGLPLAILGGAYLMLVEVLHNRKEKQDDSIFTIPVIEGEEVPISRQISAVAVLICVVVVMATGIIPLHIAAVLGALLCIISGAITGKQAAESIDWSTIFLFAGTLSLANALNTTGAGRMIAEMFISAIGEDASHYMILTAMFLLAGVLTQFMSNTVSCALIAPIGLQIAKDLGVAPHAILMTVAIASSAAFATPIATPPNTLVMGPGRLKFIDYIKIGLPLFVGTYLVCMIIIPAVWPL